MPRSTRCGQVKISFHAQETPTDFDGCRSVFINTALILWAFQVTLDPTKPLDDMKYLDGVMPLVQPCTLGFGTRVSEKELRRMMHDDPEVA